jgi:hypothetical protein
MEEVWGGAPVRFIPTCEKAVPGITRQRMKPAIVAAIDFIRQVF